ncbi:TPA: hypothetical protein HHH35_003163 [Escherichia coli]|uniref:hypothetical protein n=1 Tax=Escherichia coli TaxID=562 RepID=UPI001177E15A|nr:hypothetical protein [Escherichia coli]HAH1444750.1 hypothetical protein [Escherichia coli]HAY4162652.1 hypothetical protein [Escherichia coli]HBJ0135681.1 hypothetical protein [Escherichia coli]HCX4225149.1 hypothetical protein [Escherichia coli]
MKIYKSTMRLPRMTKYISIAILLTSLSSHAGSLMCPTSIFIQGDTTNKNGQWVNGESTTKTMSIWDCIRGGEFTYEYTLDRADRIYMGRSYYSNNVNTYSVIPGSKKPISGNSQYIAEIGYNASTLNLGYAKYENNDVQGAGIVRKVASYRPNVDIKLRPFSTTETLEGTYSVNLEDQWAYSADDDTSNHQSYIRNKLVITYTAINNHAVNMNFKDSQLSCMATTGNTCTATTALNAVNSSDNETINAKLTFQVVSDGSYNVEIQGLGMPNIPIGQPIDYMVPPFGSGDYKPLTMKIRGDTGSGIVTINATITIL